MKFRVFVPIVSIAITASLLTPAVARAEDKAPKPVELSADAIAALQTQRVDADFDLTFRAAVAALQSQSYININASKDAGTITAETDGKSKLVYNIFWGFGKKKRTQVASLLVEPIAPGVTRMNVKMTSVESKSRAGLGGGYSDGTPVMFGEPYHDFQAEFDKALAMRRADAAAAAAAAAPAATTTGGGTAGT
ncbi:MAG: hypothetical protein RLZZ58_519, partial [Pseudomonadota bacterium]